MDLNKTLFRITIGDVLAIAETTYPEIDSKELEKMIFENAENINNGLSSGLSWSEVVSDCLIEVVGH